MTIALRRLGREDLGAIRALAGGSPAAPQWSESIWAGVLERPETIALGAFAGEAMAGFALGAMTVDTLELEAIVVDPAHRRRGMGSWLLAALRDAAALRGATRIELEVRVSNEVAITLYRRAGLEDEGLRRRYYFNPEEDALLMGAPLAQVSLPQAKKSF